MDERLRKLERRFFAEVLDDFELQRLHDYYNSSIGYCPPNFVIKRIEDKLNDYNVFLQNQHRQLLQSLTDILSESIPGHHQHVIHAMDAEITAREHYALEITWAIEQLAIPTLKIQVWLRLRVQPVDLGYSYPHIYQEWLHKRQQAAEYLRGTLQSILEFCNYTTCVEVNPSTDPRQPGFTHAVIETDTIRVAALGYPTTIIRQDETCLQLPGFAEAFQTSTDVLRFGPVPEHQPLRGLFLVVPIETSNLKATASDLYDFYHQPLLIGGRGNNLRAWLLYNDIHRGYLVLAGVSNSIFRRHSYSSAEANRELGQAWEVGEEELGPPQMIYFAATAIGSIGNLNAQLSTPHFSIYVVPTPTNYFKTCDFLRLVAEV